MYKIKIDKDKLLELEITGNLATITAEVLSSVMVVYQKLKKSNSFAAKQFKENVAEAIKSGFIFEDEEGQKDILKQRQQQLDELKKALSEMLGKDGDEE